MKSKKLIGVLIILAAVLSVAVTTIVFAGGATYEPASNSFAAPEEVQVLAALPVDLEELFSSTFSGIDRDALRGNRQGFDLSQFDFSDFRALEEMFSGMFDLSALMNQTIIDFIDDLENRVLSTLRDFDWDAIKAMIGELDFADMLEKFESMDHDATWERFQEDVAAMLERFESADHGAMWERFQDATNWLLERHQRKINDLDVDFCKWEAFLESAQRKFNDFDNNFFDWEAFLERSQRNITDFDVDSLGWDFVDWETFPSLGSVDWEALLEWLP